MQSTYQNEFEKWCYLLAFIIRIYHNVRSYECQICIIKIAIRVYDSTTPAYTNVCVEIKCQLDATEVFIADLIACSTSFGHHYVHHQELKSLFVCVRQSREGGIYDYYYRQRF